MQKTMRAAWFEEFGSADKVLVVGEQPVPVLDAGQVLVQLETSGVNPSDVKKRAGSFPNLLDGGRVIPHSDGAGIIQAVSKGVAESRVGERVWVYQAQYGRRFGSAAEFLAIDQSRAVALPDNTPFEIGACLGIPAMTAHRTVFSDGAVDGQSVLITGGAGRVGHYAIQWASQAGARVIATACDPQDQKSCLEAGAVATVCHRDANWAEAVLAENDGMPVDRVIDVEFGGNLPEILKLIRTGGTIATYSSTQVANPELPFFQMMYLDLTVRFVIVYAMPEAAKQHAIADIHSKLASNDLQHRIAHSLPLAEVAAAHELIETGGFRGCVLLTLK